MAQLLLVSLEIPNERILDLWSWQVIVITHIIKLVFWIISTFQVSKLLYLHRLGAQFKDHFLRDYF